MAHIKFPHRGAPSVSWVRWGSECDQGFPFRCSPCSAAPNSCPGSSVYVYEGSKFTCCDCALLSALWRGEPGSFECDSPEEMRKHLARHAAAGHHVPMSLYDDEAQATNDRRMKEEAEKIFGPLHGASSSE